MTTLNHVQFGRGGVQLQARGDQPIPLDEIARLAPSVLAGEKHDSRSGRYTFVSTMELMRGLGREGFHPFSVAQGGSKDESKRGFTKHLIRFRSDGQKQKMKAVGDSMFEVCLLNSHDGTSAYQMFGGVLRLACLNGMIVGEGVAFAIKVPHKGDILGRVIEGAHAVIENGQKVVGHIENFRAIELKRDEQVAFAKAASALRFEEDASPVAPETLLIPHRPADEGNDLWRTFNRVQENVIRGGIGYSQQNSQGRTIHRHTRPVRAVETDVKLNRGLWTLAEEMAKLKAA